MSDDPLEWIGTAAVVIAILCLLGVVVGVPAMMLLESWGWLPGWLQ